MKTKIYCALFALVGICTFSQSGWIGINTPNPQANLDVNGTMKLRNTPAATSLPGYQILSVNLNSNGDSQVSQMNPQMLADFAVNSGANTSIYAAKKSTGITLVSLSLFPTGFRTVNFLEAERNVGVPALFSETDHSYTIPSNGTYAVGFSFKYGTGVQAGVLVNSPGVGILRTRNNVATLIDSRIFSGLDLGLVALTIAESNITSLYTFQAGDKINFGLTGSTALTAGILSTSVGSFYIYKVSN
ncbi:hypothetical protein ASG22_02650 [Chryseobacterium sp. Leaf405]|uniref:hypothetical protein n=1 Tax=Chryseobacterium sp. Leaf405 TaxID=1736367 RepID=UPI0006F2A12C|nr:hypothetical protein [Chryseobacterium sp. Leaf405]KQT35939.1 hypothetical protein ASG22_02650 [Chryseobacterium sp. Leaf405]